MIEMIIGHIDFLSQTGLTSNTGGDQHSPCHVQFPVSMPIYLLREPVSSSCHVDNLCWFLSEIYSRQSVAMGAGKSKRRVGDD